VSVYAALMRPVPARARALSPFYRGGAHEDDVERRTGIWWRFCALSSYS
jgi:hypothetical protein